MRVLVAFLLASLISGEDAPENATLLADDDAFIQEWRDGHTGIAFTMIDYGHWVSRQWGVRWGPFPAYVKWAQTYLSIATINQPMAVYRGRGYGLALHITPQYETWKYFQVQGPSRNGIVGGPGDGGSHTPDDGTHRLSMQQAGKDYSWFAQQKNAILAKYNTVYHIHDYNEFITNGVPDTAVAGIFHYEGSHDNIPDGSLCAFMDKNVRYKPPRGWPVYNYHYGSLSISRYLRCSTEVIV